jgi:lipoprotein-releasing system permease protein
MGFSLSIALRYLSSKKRGFVSVSTALAIIGVALGVAALSIVMSVTGGMQQQFREKVLGVNAHVIVLKYSTSFRNYRDVMKQVAAIHGVEAVAPFVINPMMVTHGDRTATGVLLKGVDPELMPKVLDLPRHIKEGSLQGLRKPGAVPPPSPSDPLDAPLPDDEGVRDAGAPTSLLRAIERRIAEDRANDVSATEPADSPTPSALHPEGAVVPDGGYASVLPSGDELPEALDPDPCRNPEFVAKLAGVVIGKGLSKRLEAGLGDCVQITSPQVGMTYGSSGMRAPIAKQFRVIAIFDAGFEQYDAKLAYTDLYEAQAFYEQGDSVTGVEAKVKDIDDAEDIATQLEHNLDGGTYRTMDWRALNRGLFSALLIQQVAMSVVLTLIIVVAAFTVIATLIMVVLDKKKEISLLKALGASDRSILRVFMYQGGIIGVGGTCLGLCLGWLGCRALLAYEFPLDAKVYLVSKLPVNMRPQEFIVTGIVALCISLLATVFPAMYAAKLRPSDGLRSD